MRTRGLSIIFVSVVVADVTILQYITLKEKKKLCYTQLVPSQYKTIFKCHRWFNHYVSEKVGFYKVVELARIGFVTNGATRLVDCMYNTETSVKLNTCQ